MKYLLTLSVYFITTVIILAIPKPSLSFAKAVDIANQTIQDKGLTDGHFIVSMRLSPTPESLQYLVDYNAHDKDFNISASGGRGVDRFIIISMQGEVQFIERRWSMAWLDADKKQLGPKVYYTTKKTE
ncbi:MAG: hypothetical protein AAF571_07985 [Verrucomicrobiota bacterium]